MNKYILERIAEFEKTPVDPDVTLEHASLMLGMQTLKVVKEYETLKIDEDGLHKLLIVNAMFYCMTVFKINERDGNV